MIAVLTQLKPPFKSEIYPQYVKIILSAQETSSTSTQKFDLAVNLVQILDLEFCHIGIAGLILGSLDKNTDLEQIPTEKVQAIFKFIKVRVLSWSDEEESFRGINPLIRFYCKYEKLCKEDRF